MSIEEVPRAGQRMSKLRINHVELSVPEGSIARDRGVIAAFYGEIFDFRAVEMDIDGASYFILTSDEDGSQFIGLYESAQPLQSQSLDHLGFHFEAPAEINLLFDRCKAWRQNDDRLEIKEYPDLVLPQTITHSFYFKYLLPIWVHVACIAARPGHEAGGRWRWIEDSLKRPIAAMAERSARSGHGL